MNREDQGWARIAASSAKSRRHVVLSVVERRAGPRLVMSIPAELWPVLKNTPARFSAWRKGEALLVEPDEAGPFKGGWRGKAGATYRISIDAWDGIVEEASEKFLCAPEITDDGALVVTVPAGLFKTGKPRAVAARKASPAPKPASRALPPDGPAAQRLRAALGD